MGVHQGCAFLQHLFNFYAENILRELSDNTGIKVGGYNINNFRYINDTILVSNSKEKLQHLLYSIENESKEKGLCVNVKKIQYIIISKKQTIPTCNVYIYGKRITPVKNFNYLESTVTSNGKCDEGIKKRIALAKVLFTKMTNILKSGKLSMETKPKVLSCYMLSILPYGSECWTISRTMERRHEAAEMYLYQQLLCISWVNEYISNEDVWRRIGRNRLLLTAIKM